MQLSITLPDDLAARVRQRVASGAFADESEMVREALEEMEVKDMPYAERLERWLQTEGVAAYREWRADPSNVSSFEEVEEALREAHEERRRAR